MMAAKKSQAGDEKEAATQPIADNRTVANASGVSN